MFNEHIISLGIENCKNTEIHDSPSGISSYDQAKRNVKSFLRDCSISFAIHSKIIMQTIPTLTPDSSAFLPFHITQVCFS